MVTFFSLRGTADRRYTRPLRSRIEGKQGQALVQLAATDVRAVQDEDVPAVRTGTAPRRGAA